jgi:ATP-dependent DNA helicase RecG
VRVAEKSCKILSSCLKNCFPNSYNQGGADTVSISFALPSVPIQEKSSEKILEFLKQEPNLSAKALAEKMNITSRAVEKQIALLKKTGKLRRIGPSKGGYWLVSNQPEIQQ